MMLFGVLRKELSPLMVFHAPGTQIATFPVRPTFYVPCVPAFAMMLTLLGRRGCTYQ